MRTGLPPIKTARGFARDEADERRLRAKGVKVIYRADNGETLDRVNMRKGEFLNVVDGLKGLAAHRAVMTKEVARIHKMGATVRDAETELESRTDGAEMMRLAVAPKIDPKKAAEFQAMSAKKRVDDGRSGEKRAKVMWHDQRFNLTEFEEATGWPRSTAYLQFGPRFKRKIKG